MSPVPSAETVLLLHNRYRERGGEDAVFEMESALLERHGHAVIRVVFDNDDIPDRRPLLASARLAAETVWSNQAVARVRDAVRKFRPGVAHFHNTFPLISPAAYAACKAERVAVVQTLHNYRLVCPAATLFRDGQRCEDCLGRTLPWPGVLHACYRGSRSQTAVVAGMLTAHHLRRTWKRDVDLYIALTEFSRRKLLEGGLPAHKVVVKPNFLYPDPGAKTADAGFFLFSGRLAGYKGLETLLEAWSLKDLPAPLRIAGDGPLATTVRRAAGEQPEISYLGQLDRPAVLQQMRAARALIFPSMWYENFSVTIMEAFACGLPVIASRLGAMAEIIADGRTGILFNPGDAGDLAAKVAWCVDHARELGRMGAEARREYETKYGSERNYRMLTQIYALAVARAKGRH